MLFGICLSSLSLWFLNETTQSDKDNDNTDNACAIVTEILESVRHKNKIRSCTIQLCMCQDTSPIRISCHYCTHMPMSALTWPRPQLPRPSCRRVPCRRLPVRVPCTRHRPQRGLR